MHGAGDVVLDIGANIGLFSLYCRNLVGMKVGKSKPCSLLTSSKLCALERPELTPWKPSWLCRAEWLQLSRFQKFMLPWSTTLLGTMQV